VGRASRPARVLQSPLLPSEARGATADCYTSIMKPDLYTKAVLTVIALLLLVIACNQDVNPGSKVRAEGAFAGVQYVGGYQGGYQFFDSRTGEIWWYYT
jgi:hypothetical protein